MKRIASLALISAEKTAANVSKPSHGGINFVITIGSAVTDSTGIARISFAAPPNEGDASVVVLAAGTSGRATLTVAK